MIKPGLEPGLRPRHAASTVTCFHFTAVPGRILDTDAVTLGSSARGRSHVIQEMSCPAGHLLKFIPSLVITGRTLIIKGTGSEDFECFPEITVAPRLCFLLLCSLGFSPSLPPCLPPFLPSPLPLPTPSIGGLRRHHCLNACPPGDASPPALMSQLMRRAAGQPG